MKIKPTRTDIAVADIVVPRDRLRPVSEAKVSGLIDLIRDFGFLVPIMVREAKGVITLVDGLHRLTAMQRLGAPSIPVVAVDSNQAEARGMEISANLVAGMTPLQDALFLAAWQKHYEEQHPETKRGVAGAMAKHGQQGNNSSFAEIIAETRQITPRQVRKVISSAARLSLDEAQALQRPEVKLPLSDIEAIGKINDPEARAAVIRKLSLGASKNVRVALAAWRSETGSAPAAPVETRDDKALKALRDTWNRCSAAVRRKFANEFGEEVYRWSDASAPAFEAPE